ncbi:MAG TPA: HAMP domain-containing protein [Desulfuromonadales bacterium]|nr:HAMP domain-containing protein [Desulfuromonadales bacterium]
MKLKNRFLLLLLLTLIVTLAAALPLYTWIKTDIMSGLGTHFAEKQVLYNRARVLSPLTRELALARKLAHSTEIRQWARNEEDPELRARALQELEEYRQFFTDHSYFFAIHRSGNYYHNNAENSYAGQELRYQVEVGDPEDFWYFATIGSNKPYTINVDYDEHLGVTKIWFNIVVADASGPLGVIGTGLDLTTFLETVVDSGQNGITNTFVEASGAIQAHREISRIDFRTMSKAPEERQTIYQFLDEERDQTAVKNAMRSLRAGEQDVAVVHSQVNGEDHLIGMAFIREIGWYNVTLMQYDKLLDQKPFASFGILLTATLLMLTLAILLLLNRVVLKPIARLNQSIQRFAHGTLPTRKHEPGRDELGMLEEQFQQMTREVSLTTHELEERVFRRTSELTEKNRELQAAVDEIKKLRGLLPICMSCKKIRDEEGAWNRLEEYISQHSEAEFSHSYCPECLNKAYRDAGLGSGPRGS